MTTPETALTVSALAQLVQHTERVTAASRGTASRLMDQMLGELMPGFQGETAISSLGLTNAVNEKMRLIHADQEAMGQQIAMTHQQHSAHDSGSTANFNRLSGLLNT